MANKKTATTEAQNKRKTQNRKLSVSKILNGSVVARKTLAKSKVNRKTATTETLKVPETLKRTSLRAEVFDTKGKVVEKISLPTEIFGVKINKPLLSQAVRVYLANQRLGTAKTKDRGEVNATTKKVWQQKGTGRARHGSKRAPIFVGGGVAFGPRPRDYSLNLSKKMKMAALFSALSSKFKDKQIKLIMGLEKITPKTKAMAEIMKSLNISGNGKVLLITPKTDSVRNVLRAARNIEGVEIASSNMLNAYRVLDNKSILLMNTAVDSIKNTFLKEK